MDANLEIVWRAEALLGEGPCWDASKAVLTWLDIKGLRLFQNIGRGQFKSYSTPKILSSVVVSNHGLVGALGSEICHLQLVGDAVVPAGVIARLPDPPTHLRFNDGKVAPDGAYWIGVMDDEEKRSDGAWWRLSPSGEMTEVDTGYTVTNGPAFDCERRRTYLTDSGARTIYVAEGWGADACRSKRVFRSFTEAEGYPDGMTVDSEGRVWVAFWDGAAVRALDPETAETLVELPLPASRPTSCEFGGVDHSILYVTSARAGLLHPSDVDGALFAIRIDGLSAPRSNLFFTNNPAPNNIR